MIGRIEGRSCETAVSMTTVMTIVSNKSMGVLCDLHKLNAFLTQLRQPRKIITHANRKEHIIVHIQQQRYTCGSLIYLDQEVATLLNSFIIGVYHDNDKAFCNARYQDLHLAINMNVGYNCTYWRVEKPFQCSSQAYQQMQSLLLIWSNHTVSPHLASIGSLCS